MPLLAKANFAQVPGAGPPAPGPRRLHGDPELPSRWGFFEYEAQAAVVEEAPSRCGWISSRVRMKERGGNLLWCPEVPVR